MRNIHVTCMKLRPVVQEEMLSKDKVYRRKTEGRQTKTDHNSSP